MTQLQQQPNGWSCLPTAFAMAFNIPVKEFIEHIGHDGSEILYPDNFDPYRRKSFHIQEMITLALQSDYSVTELQRKPASSVGGFIHCLPELDMGPYLQRYTGVLTGTHTGIPHAVYWDGTYILDPDCPRPYPIDKFNIDMFFVINKI